jgi:hypothetical protein
MSTDTDETRTDQNPEQEQEQEWANDESGAERDEFPPFAELAQDPNPPENDENEQTPDEFPLGAAPEDSSASEFEPASEVESASEFEPVSEVEPEGVAQPENLGGGGVGDNIGPLVGIDTQQEFLSRWTRIQISFVEDPAAAVESADALAQEISTAILSSIEHRSSELAADGRAAADTEQLRLALRQYRAYIGVLLPE